MEGVKKTISKGVDFKKMTHRIEKINCYGCGCLVDKKEGKPHKYIGATQGCWTLYEQVLTKEYGEYNYPQPTHRLTVDTYAVHHPGQPGKQSIQSVNVHLISLYLILEQGINGATATKRLGEILLKEPKFEWLEPPATNGLITVVDILKANNQKEHEKKIREWAEDVWSCWYPKYNQTIENLVNVYF